MTENHGRSRRTWVRGMVAVATGFSAALTMASTAGAATHSAGTAAKVAASCPYEYFCAYPGRNFTGTPILMYHCVEREIPWTSVGSWINNQTPGTSAQFRSSDHVTRWRDGGAYSWDTDADWSWVYWVKPC
ncbi:peptidase inhibitor family I36 protein [Streptomyces acidiscabies]|uniref:peptidase inhibitor family I36 protein n=1 Tax=Streptomyces acidiscabies TaxID=42234 RepID=UPI000AA4A0F9|nr:peptidase inhibitor family I36 protein [Streptomyces acidiscabies]